MDYTINEPKTLSLSVSHHSPHLFCFQAPTLNLPQLGPAFSQLILASPNFQYYPRTALGFAGLPNNGTPMKRPGPPTVLNEYGCS